MVKHQATVSPLPPGTRLPTIRCYQCGKLVDRVVIDHHEYMMEITIRVFCHGAEDAMKMTQMSLHEIGQDVLLEQEGIAFQPKSDATLAAPAARLSHG